MPALLFAVVVATANMPLAVEQDFDPEHPRFVEISKIFAEAESPAKTWWMAWTTTYGALAVAQGTLALTADHVFAADKVDDRRHALVVGGVSSAFGTVAMFFNKPRSIGAASDMRTERWTLEQAEDTLATAAWQERFGRSLWTQLGAVVVNATGASILAWGYDQKLDGALHFVGGMLVAQVQIFTQPMRVNEQREEERAQWHIVPAGRGLSVVGRF